MKHCDTFDWRIVREIAALVFLSTLIGIGGIYFLEPLKFNNPPAHNFVPLELLSVSSSPSSSQKNFLPPPSSNKPETELSDPVPTISGMIIPSNRLNSSESAEPTSTSTLMAQGSLSARTGEGSQPKAPPMVRPHIPSKPSVETELEVYTHVGEVNEEPIEEKNPPLEESGELSIGGVVLSVVGRPIPGIKVIASPHRLFNKDGGNVGSIKDRYSLTDEAGSYEFEHVFNGEYLLRTEATPSYRSVTKHVRAGIQQVILVLTPEGIREVRGLVKDSRSGYPLSGVSIATASQLATSDDQGYYQISVPRQTSGQPSTILRFIHQDYHKELVTVPRQSSNVDGPITLADILLKPIQGFASVKGTVESLYGGAPLKSVRVFLSPENGHSQLDALTNQEGRFQFPSVAWGTYTLVVAPTDGHKDFKQEKLKVGEGPIEDIQIRLEPSPVGVLRGQMVDPEGQPVRGLTLWLRSLSVRTFAGKPVTSDPSGNFEIYDVPSGEFQLSTQAEPHLQITGLHLQPGEIFPLQLVVDWGSLVLSGQIVNAGGLPIPGASISLIWMQEKGGLKSRAIRTTSADDSGVFRFTQLGAGPHKLNVSAAGYHRTLLEHVVGPDPSDVQVVLSRIDF